MIHLPGDVEALKWGVESKYLSEPRVHPNGFIQMDSLKRPGVRVHFWHPALGIRQKTYSPIHDHTFSFVSKVIRGRLFNMKYGVEGTLRPTHDVWTCYADGVNNSTLRNDETSIAVKLVPGPCRSVLSGENYSMEIGQFHEVAVSVPTITMMEKTARSKGTRPRVLVPVGQEPDNDYRRDDVDLSHIYEIIKECYE